MRLLGSTLSTETILDDLHVSEMIQRKCKWVIRLSPYITQTHAQSLFVVMKDGNPQGALQFADLSRRLAAKRSLEKPWKLLYILCKISDSQQTGVSKLIYKN
jgi:hypothetical protein